MTIQGLQIIYRLKSTIRLFIDYRASVDSFNLYYSDAEIGPYTLLANIPNVASKIPSTKGKNVFEFHPETLAGWDNEARNYLKLAPVVGGVEGVVEGPLMVPTRVENIIPKEFSVMYGLNTDSQKFIPISVDSDGKVMTI